MDYEPGKSKLLAKGNSKEIPTKSNSNCPKGMTQQLSLSLSLSLSELACVSIHMRSIPFINKPNANHLSSFQNL